MSRTKPVRVAYHAKWFGKVEYYFNLILLCRPLVIKHIICVYHMTVSEALGHTVN